MSVHVQPEYRKDVFLGSITKIQHFFDKCYQDTTRDKPTSACWRQITKYNTLFAYEIIFCQEKIGSFLDKNFIFDILKLVYTDAFF